MLLEHEHRPQPHRPLATAPHIHALDLPAPQELVALRTVKRNERPHAFPS